MLGIIGAMDKEVDALQAQMEDAREESIGFARYTCGTLWGVRVCLARCGVGKVHAALCAQGMILRFGADKVLNIGVAGALRDSLRIGDIVIADSAVQHDIDTTPVGDPPGMISGPDIVQLPCDQGMIETIKKAADDADLRWETGAVATGDQFIVGTEKKDGLASAFHAAVCDMEGGAIAQCCYEMGVPFAAVRAVSDTRLGDGAEYVLRAQAACRSAEKLLERLVLLLAKEGETQHG